MRRPREQLRLRRNDWLMMLPERLPLDEIPEGLPEFVDGVLLPFLTAGHPSQTVWCPQWREHPDAVHRLAAMSDEWSHMLAEEDASLHSFMRDVLDYHLPLLTDVEKGTFRRCSFGHAPHKRLDVAKPADSAERSQLTKRE